MPCIGTSAGYPFSGGPITLQPSGSGLVFKSLGVAKQYCRIDLIGDTFVQC